MADLLLSHACLFGSVSLLISCNRDFSPHTYTRRWPENVAYMQLDYYIYTI